MVTPQVKTNFRLIWLDWELNQIPIAAEIRTLIITLTILTMQYEGSNNYTNDGAFKQNRLSQNIQMLCEKSKTRN